MSQYTARLVYRIRPASRFPCHPGTAVLRLHRRGDPPFSGCTSQRAFTMLANESGRIFDQRKLFGFEYRAQAYACLYSVNKRFPLEENSFSDFDGVGTRLFHFRLVGPYAAFIASSAGPAYGLDFFKVIDLRDGRMLRESPRYSPNQGIRDLELTNEGSVAWTEDPTPSDRVNEVWISDLSGTRRVDSGTRVEGGSLTIAGSVVSWRNAGATRTAPIH
jgi:hypothetical protein